MSPSTPRPSGAAPDADHNVTHRFGVLAIAFLASVSATFFVDSADSEELRSSAPPTSVPELARVDDSSQSSAETLDALDDGSSDVSPTSAPANRLLAAPTTGASDTTDTSNTNGSSNADASGTSNSTDSSGPDTSDSGTPDSSAPGTSDSSAPDTSDASTPDTLDSSPSDASTTDSTRRYVDRSNPKASDSNPGTADRPWRTLTKAGRTARPGQRVVIHGGTYTEGLDITVSGEPGSRIVFEAAPGEEVELRNQCVEAIGQSHIEIRGLTIRDCNGDDDDTIGIRVEGPDVDDVVIDANHIVNTYGSAISAWGVPWLDDPGDFRNVTNLVITGNLIERANNGGYNEQITLANGVVDFEVAYNELRDSHNTVNGGEGIDVKEGSSSGTIHHNLIYDIGRRAIYIDGGGRADWSSPVHDIDVYANIAYDVPNGFAIMSEGGADVYNVRVFNNVFHDIEHDCIFMYDHPNTSNDSTIGLFRNIAFVNNTLVNCGQDESWRMGIDINTDKATDVLIRNNIAWPRGIDPGTAETVDHNLTDDPRFVDGDNGVFTLMPNSPARDSGSPSGAPSHDIVRTPRPSGDGVDIGAYEG